MKGFNTTELYIKNKMVNYEYFTSLNKLGRVAYKNNIFYFNTLSKSSIIFQSEFPIWFWISLIPSPGVTDPN